MTEPDCLAVGEGNEVREELRDLVADPVQAAKVLAGAAAAAHIRLHNRDVLPAWARKRHTLAGQGPAS
jgi:hypothetical protein